MLFSRTYRYHSGLSSEEIKSRLIGKHVKVHNLDFEVLEKDRMIKVIPHAETVDGVNTLPITHVEFNGDSGTGTRVVITSKMRKIDRGGPYLIIAFVCFLLLIGLSAFFWQKTIGIIVISIAISISVAFFLMLTGYFNYAKKVKEFVQTHSEAELA